MADAPAHAKPPGRAVIVELRFHRWQNQLEKAMRRNRSALQGVRFALRIDNRASLADQLDAVVGGIEDLHDQPVIDGAKPIFERVDVHDGVVFCGHMCGEVGGGLNQVVFEVAAAGRD